MDSAPHPSTAIPTFAATDEIFGLLVQCVRDYAIFMLDPSGRVSSWNEGAQRIKGYRESEILGKHFSIFYPQSAIDSGWPDYELEVAERLGRFEDEGWRIRKDGTMFWADVVITAVRDANGVLRGFAKVTRDLTERRIAEEALRLSEERYRSLVDAIRDYAIFMIDPNGYVVTWNSGAERLKGYTAQEIIGKHFSVFYSPERAGSGLPERELAIARTEGRFEEENWRMRKDGTRFWANVVLTAVRNKDGVLQGFSKVTRDITERRKLELQLQARLDELSATNRTLAEKSREIEAFVYGVSHDVRGPLVNLQGFSREIQRSGQELTQLIESDTSMPAEMREQVHSILNRDMTEATGYLQTAATHLAKIVDALLRLSRLGRVAYECKQVDVEDIVRRVLRSHQVTIGRMMATIELRELPPVWADASAIEQIFSNLIANALRYAHPQRPPRIEIGGSEDGQRSVTYFVKDNGLGIPQAAIADLFTAFRRFHPECAPGEGIGLAMVRRMVERLQGTIRVESKEGEGSTFFLSLPNAERAL